MRRLFIKYSLLSFRKQTRYLIYTLFLITCLFIFGWILALYRNPKSNESRENIEHEERHNVLKKNEKLFSKCKREYGVSLKKIENIDDYTRPSPKYTHSIRMLRAFVMYIEVFYSEPSELDFRWLYRSWIEMQKYEPAKWRTDLIIFIQNENKIFSNPHFFLNELNCSFSNKRRSETDEPMCTLIDHIPMNNRNLKSNIDEKTFSFRHTLEKMDLFSDDPENLSIFYSLITKHIPNYSDVDKLLMLIEGYRYFKLAGYDFLAKVEMDSFIGPSFGKWLPRKCNDFYVSNAELQESINPRRTKYLAGELNLNALNGKNYGFTWISRAENLRAIAFLTIYTMTFIASEEYLLYSKDKNEQMIWPNWYYEIFSAYGAMLAVNHVTLSGNFTTIKLYNSIDIDSDDENRIDGKLIIKPTLGGMTFSKAKFKEGTEDKAYLAKDSRIVQYYCLKMAMLGKDTSRKDLYQLFLETTSSKA